jgi:hypothetical protein
LIAVAVKVVFRLFFVFKKCAQCGTPTLQISDHYGLELIPPMFGSYRDAIKQTAEWRGLTCKLCDQRIWPGTKVLRIMFASFPRGEAMEEFNCMKCHPACWKSWPLRTQFVEQFNRFREDCKLRPDGHVDHVTADGKVRIHEKRIYIATVHDI